jgi:hypothetical protein
MGLPNDPHRGDKMNPFGKSRGATKMYWLVGGLLLLMIAAIVAF